ncbi:Minichromosome maintenance protein MCM [uncultured archaeon]|nr:Minichromosome maintenance protein MCM [uncultured archaeon]
MANPDPTPIVEKFEEFFSDYYERQFAELKLKYPEQKSFVFSFKKLGEADRDFADKMVENPDLFLMAAQMALISMAGEERKGKFEPHVRVEEVEIGSKGPILIQSVGSENIHKMVHVEGVVTKRAEIRPRVKIAVYRCMNCETIHKIPIEKGTFIPEVCDNCKKRALDLDEKASYFVNIQRAEIQELLERVRSGSPASHIEMILDDDLCNSIVPGDTIEVTGILRLRPIAKTKEPVYAKYIDVINVRNVQREFEDVELTKDDIKQIQEFSKRPDAFEILVNSVAPSIYGHREMKEAVTLQLFGGNPDKTLPEGGRIRPEIHLLIIGDPGAAKTRMLQYVTMLAPKSIYVSGKYVTGVGLTASAERDDLGEGWTLKAGALVLASGGLAGVDEFDKIDEIERAALHEVMESGTVSVAKAGIVAKFKARTAILAAANPKFGRFDPNQLPAEQFDIPPTLQSRFDLIFPIRDVMDEEKDRKLAQYLITTHRNAAEHVVPERTVPQVETDFLRKYIAYSRKNIKPVLTHEASKEIESYYVTLRDFGKRQGAVPITPRQIEGLIRMSEASAKTRMSEVVELRDAKLAIKLVDFVLREIALDKTTGKIDIDIISTGQPRSRAEQYYDVVGLIRDLAKHYDMVPRETIFEEAKKQLNIDEGILRRFLDEMQKKGELFEPKPGFLKFVQKYD